MFSNLQSNLSAAVAAMFCAAVVIGTSIAPAVNTGTGVIA